MSEHFTFPANLGQATRAIEELQSSGPSAQKQQTSAAKEDAGIEEQVEDGLTMNVFL